MECCDAQIFFIDFKRFKTALFYSLKKSFSPDNGLIAASVHFTELPGGPVPIED